jgi:hypothetical protein
VELSRLVHVRSSKIAIVTQVGPNTNIIECPPKCCRPHKIDENQASWNDVKFDAHAIQNVGASKIKPNPKESHGKNP